MSGYSIVRQSLDAVAQNASTDIAQAVETVAGEFVARGGYGSYRMHVVGNETIVRIFRLAAARMTVEARQCTDTRAGHRLLDSHLSQVVDRTIADRAAQFRMGNVTPDDSAALCAYLHQDMKRVKDAAVRELELT